MKRKPKSQPNMDDDLPDISVNDSSFNDSQEFEMPDASLIATQRNIEDLQDDEIKKYRAEIKKYQAENAETQSCSEGSDNDIAICLELLRVEVPNINIPHEHPGEDIAALNRLDILAGFNEVKAVYLDNFLDFLLDTSKNANSESILTLFFDSLHNVIIEDSFAFDGEDIHCQIILLSLLLFWAQKNQRVSQQTLRSYIHVLLDEVGTNVVDDHLISKISHHLLKIFKHHHNRLYLAQSIQSSCSDPQNLAETRNHSDRMTFILSFDSLSDIIGTNITNIDFKSFYITDLKKIIVEGVKWKLLTPYEIYTAVMFINLLLSYAKIRMTESQQENKDTAAQKDILDFLNSLNCNSSSSSNDFMKVKVLIAKTCLFWQEKRGKNCVISDK